MAKEKSTQAQEAAAAKTITGAEDTHPTQHFMEKNRTAVIAGGGILVVGLLATLYFSGAFSGSNDEANAQMYRAARYFEQDSIAKSIKGDAQNPGFETIADEFGGSKAGNLAQYYAGVANLKQGNADAGIEHLESFSKGENMLSVSAYLALGFAAEDKGDAGKAAGYFEKAASCVDANEHTTPFALMQAARAYEAQKEYSDALSIYQRIKKDFPASTEAARIGKYIARAQALAGK